MGRNITKGARDYLKVYVPKMSKEFQGNFIIKFSYAWVDEIHAAIDTIPEDQVVAAMTYVSKTLNGVRQE